VVTDGFLARFFGGILVSFLRFGCAPKLRVGIRSTTTLSSSEFGTAVKIYEQQTIISIINEERIVQCFFSLGHVYLFSITVITSTFDSA